MVNLRKLILIPLAAVATLLLLWMLGKAVSLIGTLVLGAGLAAFLYLVLKSARGAKKDGAS